LYLSHDAQEPGLVSEIFSLTAIAWYLFTRTLPYDTRELATDRDTFPSSNGSFRTLFDPRHQQQLPDLFCDAIKRGLAVNPNDRFQTAMDLFQHLARALDQL